MKFTELDIPDLYLIEPECHEDERGYFMENYNFDKFEVGNIHWKQVSQSHTIHQGTIRGLHYQVPWTWKMVWVSQGAILDAVVDIRKYSPTFNQSHTQELNDKNHHILLVPPGLAHGFQALTDDVIYHNMMSENFNPGGDAGINPLKQGIVWPIEPTNLSRKDTNAPKKPKIVHEGKFFS